MVFDDDADMFIVVAVAVPGTLASRESVDGVPVDAIVSF